MSPLFAYLEMEFIDGREPSSSTIREHMYRVAFADPCDIVLIATLTRAFPVRDLATQDLPGVDSHMRIGHARAF